LVTPRPHLRIIPGKLSGEPHVAHTRVATRSLAALRRDGLSVENISSLYPDLSNAAIGESWELEEQLEANVLPAA